MFCPTRCHPPRCTPTETTKTTAEQIYRILLELTWQECPWKSLDKIITINGEDQLAAVTTGLELTERHFQLGVPKRRERRRWSEDTKLPELHRPLERVYMTERDHVVG